VDVSIALADTGTVITNNNGCVTESGGVVLITCAGTYLFTGSRNEGQIQVNAAAANVYLVLNGVDISNSTDAVIYGLNSDKILMVLPEGSVNILSDGASRPAAADTAGACVYSKDDLTVKGTGTLSVTGYFNNGIHSTNDLRIKDSPTILVNSVNHALKGKGSIEVDGGVLELNSESGDGMHSNEGEESGDDSDKGYIIVNGGSIAINAGDDGIQAYNAITIYGGTIAVSATGDAVHSDGNVQVAGGVLTLSAGDDGVHAEDTLYVDDGEINVTASYEGLEGLYVYMRGGTNRIVSSDDGINAAGGADNSSGWGGLSAGSGYLEISGGFIYVNASGDGLDSNGDLLITGGTMIVDGPASSSNGALDKGDNNNSLTVSGGLLVAYGSSGMAESASAGTQYTVKITLSTVPSAGTLVSLQSTSGEVVTFVPVKTVGQSSGGRGGGMSSSGATLVVSSPDFVNGGTYTLYTGGSHSGTLADGIYTGGSYTAGSQVAEFTLSSSMQVTVNGN
jgi:hypothetical protein